MRAGRWEVLASTNICGKTLGIVGLGRIGKAVARRALGFNMTVLATDLVQDEAFIRQYDVTYLPLSELLRCADSVSINVPLSREKRHLIDDLALRRMKPTAFLINTARGGLVDEDALAAYSREGLREAGVLAAQGVVAVSGEKAPTLRSWSILKCFPKRAPGILYSSAQPLVRRWTGPMSRSARARNSSAWVICCDASCGVTVVPPLP